MANKYYQYETSPRKLAPEYEPKRKATKKKTVKKVDKKQKEKVQTRKQARKNEAKNRFLIFIHIAIIFAVVLFLIYRTSLINQSFAQIQKLKHEVTDLQKENDQLEIGIQNSMNINNVEQSAKDLLGMQKLSSKQTVYLTLPKKDYVEPSTEEVILEEETGIWATINNFINDIF